MTIAPSESDRRTTLRIELAFVSRGLVLAELALLAYAAWWLWQAHVDPRASIVVASRGVYGDTNARSIGLFALFLAGWVPPIAWLYHRAGRRV